MLSILFFFLSGIFNSIMDVLSFRYHTSVFRSLNSDFWNPELSWRNKWKNGDPTHGERFPGSSTVFVSLTDGWHLAKSLMLTSITLTIITVEHYTPMINYIADFIIYRTIFGVAFNLFFKKILIGK